MAQETSSSRAELARENFLSGCNCAQAVLLSFRDVLEMDEKTLLRLASPFGGGMGRLREVCGAFTGALMALGLKEGYDDLNDPELKRDTYRRVQDLAAAFRAETGSLLCRDLLADTQLQNPTGATPDARTREYYEARPCPALCALAAKLAEEAIAKVQEEIGGKKGG